MTSQPGNPFAAVRDACTELVRTDTPVTFAEVAARTDISRTTLYRRRDLRELIEQHRDPAGDAITLTGLAIQIDQLRQSLEAVAANVRRHEEHLRALRRTEHAS